MTRIHWLRRGGPLLALLIAVSAAQAAASGGENLHPVPIAGAVVRAFANHDVVAIGDDYRSTTEHRLFRGLLKDPQIQALRPVIFVEFGNARYQSLVDRYVTSLGRVQGLSRVWDETTQQSGIWDQPDYAGFFRYVRMLNAGISKSRRLRVVVTDPPVDLRKIKHCPNPIEDSTSSHCTGYWFQRRDLFFASLVRRYALSHGRKALVLENPDRIWRYPRSLPPREQNTVGLLESDGRTRVFVISPYVGFAQAQPREAALIQAWPRGSAATITDTTLGEIRGRQALFGAPPRSTPRQPRREDPRAVMPLSQIFDAYFYFGD